MAMNLADVTGLLFKKPFFFSQCFPKVLVTVTVVER
jgi:hypothetical protein